MGRMNCFTGEESLYVVEFSDGTVKVGRSIRPSTRISEHRIAAACFGIKVLRTQAFPCSSNAVLAEAEAIRLCIKSADAVRRSEWFVGLPFDAAVAIAQAAALTPRDAIGVRAQLLFAGGPTAVARHLGLSVDTVREWTAIPARHTAKVHALLKRREIA